MGTKELKNPLEILLSTKTIIKQESVSDNIQKVVTEEIFIHPKVGEITKQCLYTFDANGNLINKEAYVPEVINRFSLVEIFQKLTSDELAEIKKILGI